MKKLLIAAVMVSMTSGAAFAQAGTPQGDSIVPNPPRSASSNDRSRAPAAVIQGSQREATTRRHVKKPSKHK